MDDDRLEREIGIRLAHGASRDELIEEVVLTRNVGWGEAEALVDAAARRQGWRIAGRQMPYQILLGLIAIIGGVVLVVLALADWLGMLWRTLIVRGNLFAMIAETFWVTIDLPRFGLGVALAVGGGALLRRALRGLEPAKR